MQGDDHLDRESLKYQVFPDHFFQHWNGYNIVSPLHEPVPVGALVPQYYGHHVPDKDIPVRKEKRVAAVDDVGQSDMGDVGGGEELHYRSPIILMENCGSLIDIDTLNINDKHECTSLIFRFHHAGSVHHSVAPRNILFQPGPLTEFPLFHMANQMAPNPRDRVFNFRLIDFRRSKLFGNSLVHAGEEFIVERTIGVPRTRDGNEIRAFVRLFFL
ncbi:uncharacterized protein LACBIDRAFT_296154 [Laccaria bicolor S238N-H82]|uniref:Predicted protein n=1 Tax=Laccaria bicolor (strain S238N-H82 / ATCC MYA-4686) TaxID=486041 RepID=B0E2X5_LACBS|nr:uncharacterized protein LACBIDRAFT_296154 [Laccaria bicolor S238N-H82]EDQ98814.1 predicted protein [Laccaria bicolor S238N-H82]|eukprot:XP_001890544.1 predicted protein [Laccaria bicolor S238N-H82]